jgi:hypothetical protein
LEDILELDQRYRIDSKNVIETFGYDSEEHRTISEKMQTTDAENYYRIDAVLKKFGYPSIDSVGEEAAKTPWLVIHHSPIYEHRVKWFPAIYSAYQDGNINESRMLLFLERMQHWKFKETFQMKSPYIIEDKIDTLISLLRLEEIIEK